MIRRPGRTAKVTPQMVLEIRREYAEGKMSQPDLARKYGIGPGQIGKIVRGEAWMDVTAGEPVVTDQGAALRILGETGGRIVPMASPEELNAGAQRLFEMQKAMKREQEEKAQNDPFAPGGRFDGSGLDEWRERIERITPEEREVEESRMKEYEKGRMERMAQVEEKAKARELELQADSSDRRASELLNQLKEH